jgi:protein phosphatase
MTDQYAKTIRIPELALVVLIGVSGSGKSSFAAKHFKATEVISSDFCRGLVSDDENDHSATNAAFEVLHFIAGKRLEAGKLTVIDATNVQQSSRKALIELGQRHHVLLHAIVLDVPPEICRERNEKRPDRDFGDHVLRNQLNQLNRSFRGLKREGFHNLTILNGIAEIDSVKIEREPLLNDRKWDHGPFDVIGDVHGCVDELRLLLTNLGYELSDDGSNASHPERRKAFFVGDLVDRGPDSPGVLRLVMNMVSAGSALCVPGNHEAKLLKALKGRNVSITHGLAETLEQLSHETEEFKSEVQTFIYDLVSHLVVDDGKLVVAHAGLRQEMQGRASKVVRSFAMYGDTTGETDEYGLPVRYPWAREYRGPATVAYGHTPVPEPEWINNTICLDTGCVFGGSLTALRYPERELVSVAAARMYYEPVKPLVVDTTEDLRDPSDLDLQDVVGKRQVSTEYMGSLTIREENAIAALEVMSRFAADPRWLVYLPPTMAPTATTNQPGLLEHPSEAFATFARDGVERVICEEKHMGSRAVVVVCRDSDVAQRRFHVRNSVDAGVIVTRTGRPFFNDASMQTTVLNRLRAAIDTLGLWGELETDWLVIDAELLPWSLKAEDLLRRQYASVGASASVTTAAELSTLKAAADRGLEVDALLTAAEHRGAAVSGFIDAYRHYCWEVKSVEDVRLAPFQILAGEGKVHALTRHDWHIEVINRLCEADAELFRRTRNFTVDLSDETNINEGIGWWEELTGAGGEGMVVKPMQVVHRQSKGLTQPGIKCRGKEYLRIIYGPEYTEPDNLGRLRERGLGLKRSLALREFALGIESLKRFVESEPLYRVHEAVFGVLALESQPVDPRL